MATSETLPKASRPGRILVIDDEPYVGRAIGLFLSDEHEVKVVLEAREALMLLDAGERYDVILCDLMMPRIGGEDFFAALTVSHPELLDRVVFITGGAFTARARAFLDRIPNERIEKPPDPRELRARMRERVARALEREIVAQEQTG